MEDILTRRAALRALVTMRQAEPKPTTASMLQKATGYTAAPAAELRRDLEAWGLITVEEGYRNRLPFVEMRLTPEGRALAELGIKAEEVAKKAREKKLRQKSA